MNADEIRASFEQPMWDDNGVYRGVFWQWQAQLAKQRAETAVRRQARLRRMRLIMLRLDGCRVSDIARFDGTTRSAAYVRVNDPEALGAVLSCLRALT